MLAVTSGLLSPRTEALSLGAILAVSKLGIRSLTVEQKQSSAVSYSKHSSGQSSLIGGLLSSIVLGGILGITFFAISTQLGLLDSALRMTGLSESRGRIGGVHFVVAGVIFGAILDFIGKLSSRGR